MLRHVVLSFQPFRGLGLILSVSKLVLHINALGELTGTPRVSTRSLTSWKDFAGMFSFIPGNMTFRRISIFGLSRQM